MGRTCLHAIALGSPGGVLHGSHVVACYCGADCSVLVATCGEGLSPGQAEQHVHPREAGMALVLEQTYLQGR